MLARARRVAAEVGPRATVLSVDAAGAGAFEHVSRAAMLAALHAQPMLQPLLPYARQFYTTASRYVWTDFGVEVGGRFMTSYIGNRM